jgi:4-amino-4-deoxy-L-arabinose transferase-like glycosyltransferase
VPVPLRALVGTIPTWVVVLTLTAGFAVVAWAGLEQHRGAGGEDSYAYVDYVQWLDKQHRIPRQDQNYEYALPIGVPWVGVLVQRAFGPPRYDDPSSPPLQGLPKLLRRLLWIGLVLGGAIALVRARPPQPRWLLGAGLWLAAAAWAAAYVIAAANNEAWIPLTLIAFFTSVGLVPATAWLAHEVWPDRPRLPIFAAFAACLLPVIFAETLYFHPDPPFALLTTIAVALVVRALRTGLTVWAGAAAGAVLGLAGLARQSVPVVIVSLALAVVLAVRRSSVRYLAAGVVSGFAVLGWWWYQQWERYSNPVKSNLNRPGYMIAHPPLSFYVSFPTELVTHPYKPSFMRTLLPRFHAYLWSDWYGGYHQWNDPKRFATFFASMQSVLGLGGDALVLGGAATLGVPALERVARQRSLLPTDAAFATLTLLFVLSWAGFVAMLTRFAQYDNDPTKARYLLFLAPTAAIFGVAAGQALVRRGGWRRAVFLGWLAAYATSWIFTIATAF